jgi:hypothetical protein
VRGPDFLVIGAAKAGTSAFFDALCSDPRVFQPPVKEPLYFALGGVAPSFEPSDYGAIVRHQARWEAGDYEALFAGAGDRLRGEASTIYLYSPTAPAAIAEQAPEAKLIAVLRDPVERARSAFAHLRRDGFEPLDDLRAALDAEDLRVKCGYAPLWHYRRGGMYGEQLERYLERFDRDRILLIRYEELAARPQEAVSGALRFLGLDPVPTGAFTRRLNPGGEARSARLQRLLVGPNALKRVARRVLPAPARRRIWRTLLARNVRAVDDRIDPELEAEMRGWFADDLRRVERITGWDLRAWRGGSA